MDHLTLASCLACGQTTHAILHDRNIVLIPKSIQVSNNNVVTNYNIGGFLKKEARQVCVLLVSKMLLS